MKNAINQNNIVLKNMDVNKSGDRKYAIFQILRSAIGSHWRGRELPREQQGAAAFALWGVQLFEPCCQGGGTDGFKPGSADVEQGFHHQKPAPWLEQRTGLVEKGLKVRDFMDHVIGQHKIRLNPRIQINGILGAPVAGDNG